MSMPTGRSEKRTPIELSVVLSRLNQKSYKERTIAENISSRGLRAITGRMWRPGVRLLVSYGDEDFHEEASVVYCQPLGNKRFAVGLILLAKVRRLDKRPFLTAPRPGSPAKE